MRARIFVNVFESLYQLKQDWANSNGETVNDSTGRKSSWFPPKLTPPSTPSQNEEAGEPLWSPKTFKNPGSQPPDSYWPQQGSEEHFWWWKLLLRRSRPNLRYQFHETELVLVSGEPIALNSKRINGEGCRKLEEVPLGHVRAFPPLDVNIPIPAALGWNLSFSHYQQRRPSFF